MNGLQIFTKKEFGSVRVVEHEGEPWFVASDVAKALGYERPNDAVNAHCKKLNKFSYGKSPQGAMPYNIIPESDVYRLVMRSNLPSAVEFQDWICEEVIPEIRRRGFYGVNPIPPALPDFTNPVEAARAWADEREAAQLAQATAQAAIAERDHAIKTRGQIGSRREASALGLLSAEKRRSEHYAEQLGIGRSWKAVKAIPWVLDVFAPSKGMWSVLGRKLKEYSKELGYEVRQIDDERYGKINAYHVGVIEAFRRRLDDIPGMMGRYRTVPAPVTLWKSVAVIACLRRNSPGSRRWKGSGRPPHGIRTCGPARSTAGAGCTGRPARSAGTGLKENLKVPNSNTKKARWGNTGPRRMKTCELSIKTLKAVCPQTGVPSRERWCDGVVPMV